MTLEWGTFEDLEVICPPQQIRLTTITYDKNGNEISRKEEMIGAKTWEEFHAQNLHN